MVLKNVRICPLNRLKIFLLLYFYLTKTNIDLYYFLEVDDQ